MAPLRILVHGFQIISDHQLYRFGCYLPVSARTLVVHKSLANQYQSQISTPHSSLSWMHGNRKLCGRKCLISASGSEWNFLLLHANLWLAGTSVCLSHSNLDVREDLLDVSEDLLQSSFLGIQMLQSHTLPNFSSVEGAL